MEPYQNTMAEFNPWRKEEMDTEVLEFETQHLVVWNDDVNTFDWVIESLIDVCEHSPEQAEQCAILVHYKGKCNVKSGSFKELRPKCEALIDRGINATVD